MTGFRKGEALGLHWKDIDFEEDVIRLWNEKDNREDIFPLFPDLKDFLLKLKSAGRIFPFTHPCKLRKL